jgi:hypothetical protein
MIVLSRVERYLIYEVQRDFFYIGQRGGRWENGLWIFFVDLDVKATNWEKPCVKHVQLSVIWFNQGNLDLISKQVYSTANKMGDVRIT